MGDFTHNWQDYNKVKAVCRINDEGLLEQQKALDFVESFGSVMRQFTRLHGKICCFREAHQAGATIGWNMYRQSSGWTILSLT
jgi:hypothetical protein